MGGNLQSQEKGLERRDFRPTRPEAEAVPRTAAALTALCSVSRPGPGIVRASSVFPILSTILLLLGGLCIGAGRFYSRKNNIVLSAGILFVAAGEPRRLRSAGTGRAPGACAGLGAPTRGRCS